MGQQHEQAMECINRASTLCKDTKRFSTLLASITRQRGSILDALGRHGEALAHYQSLLARALADHGANSVEVAGAMIPVGYSNSIAGDEAAAENNFRGALVLLERHSLGDSFICSDALYGRSQVLGRRGIGNEALAALERCLAIRRKTMPPGHPSITEARKRTRLL